MGLLFAHCSNLSAARRLLIWYCLFTGDSFFLAEKCPEPITARGESPTFYDFPDILCSFTRLADFYCVCNEPLRVSLGLGSLIAMLDFVREGKAHRKHPGSGGRTQQHGKEEQYRFDKDRKSVV